MMRFPARPGRGEVDGSETGWCRHGGRAQGLDTRSPCPCLHRARNRCAPLFQDGYWIHAHILHPAGPVSTLVLQEGAPRRRRTCLRDGRNEPCRRRPLVGDGYSRRDVLYHHLGRRIDLRGTRQSQGRVAGEEGRGGEEALCTRRVPLRGDPPPEGPTRDAAGEPRLDAQAD